LCASTTSATIQLDYQLPQRFGLKYKGPNNEELKPIVIHRAMYGSFERFIGILLEHYQGDLPVWLAPIQAVILPISDSFVEYAEHIKSLLRDFRVEVDYSSSTLPHKIAIAEGRKIPYVIVVGKRELENTTVNVRVNNQKREIELDRLKEELETSDSFAFSLGNSDDRNR
jgi:threonyl-tRNA synthetase